MTLSRYNLLLCGKKTVYPKLETGFTFKPHMNDIYVV